MFDTTIAEEVLIARWTGTVALICLLVSQLVTPVTPLFKNKAGWNRQKYKLRKYSGVSAAFFALLHAALLYVTFLEQDFSIIIEKQWLHAGAAAALIFSMLLITSVKRVIQWLGPLWKALHALSYSLWFLISLHLWGAPYAPFWAPSLTLGLGIVLLLARVLKFTWLNKGRG